ncbi:MAG: hypothetical protein M1167_06285 [Chloroflexi bacterium]|nr:hypothetical protein [Chloroflexota bacterium]
MTEEEKRFNPTFENGGYWEYYKDIERQFESFLEYVPYLEGNEQTYSFKLLNIFLSIGGHVDSAFKEMARYSEFIENPSCVEILKRADEKSGIIVSGVRAFDEIYGLCSKKVTFRCLPERITLTPFSTNKPEWWDYYNEIKHNVSINLKKANLKNVRDALAGAFLLNAIHKPASKRLFEYHMLKPKYQQGTTFWQTINDTFNGQEMYPKRQLGKQLKNPFTLETSLFEYDYEESV